MKRAMILAAIGLALAAGAARTAASEPWLHVHVVESGGDGETVRVNVPIELVEKVLPLIRHERLREGKVRIEMGDSDFSTADLRAVWQAVRTSRDAEYVTVEGPDEKVRVAKRGEEILVLVDGTAQKAEKVEARIPLDVLDALFSGPEEELDVQAAIRVLARRGSGDIVTVEDGDTRVRVWIDSSEDGR